MGSQEFLTRDEWRKVVKQCLGTSQFEVLNCKVKRLSEGGGFLGEHRLAEITVRPLDTEERVLNFFIKAQPKTLAEQREFVEKTGAFQKEVDILNKLFVELRSVLENGGEGMEWCCKCFYTRPDVIVLEDMAVKGFRVVNSRIESRWQHCAVILKALANLHSASFIFEEKHPTQPYRLDMEYADMLKDTVFVFEENHLCTQWVRAGVRVVWKLIEEIRGAEALREMKTQIEDAMMSIFDMVKTSERFRNCVSHGDMWRNNMFFRHEEGEPVEARLCDYQIVRYTPPANDITSFLYITTPPSFRAQYMSQLLPYYYKQLTQNLRRHGVDPEQVLSWEEFKESCEFYKKLGVALASCYCAFTLMNEDNYKHIFESSEEYERFLKHDRTPEVMHSFKNDSLYRERMTEVIEELIEVCVDKK